MTTNSSTGQSTPGLVDKAAESADALIQSARQKAQTALDGLSDTFKNVQDHASATLERLRPPFDSMASYTRREPTKALLIAAAAGAGIMGLIALIARSGGGRSPTSTEILRKTVADMADSLRRSARDTADRASAQADSALQSARSTAKAAYGGLTDTMQQLKDHAAPIVDRVRPQLDSVMTYAKDEPGKALLIAAATGAALMGLMSSINR